MKVEVLDNGLVIIIDPIKEFESVACSLIITGGMVADLPDTVGASLILTELLNRGAGDLSHIDYAEFVDSLGARLWQECFYDRFTLSAICYHRRLTDVLKLLSLKVRVPRLPESELSSIKNSLLQQIEAVKDSPSDLALERLNALYFNPPYNRSLLGDSSGLHQATYENITDIWSRCFKPNGSILSLAGKIAIDDALQLSKELFGDWQGEAEALPEIVTATRWSYKHIDYNSEQTQVAIILPGYNLEHPLYFAALVYTKIMSNGLVGRLFIEVREKRGLAYSVYLSDNIVHNYGYFLLYAGTTADRATETLDVIKETITTATLGNITANEILRAKNGLKTSLTLASQSAQSRAVANAKHWFKLGKLLTLAEMLQKVNDVTLDQIQQVAEAVDFKSGSVLTLGGRALNLDS
ncbi:MAG TPA: pitrilysin family protein [Oligoflexia bacterium]|nr:pitrilysin family protein [Oligoflexia bacterium]HMP27724.1 pitrilysin family protein [Oligoflexia bacterium]